MGSDCLRCQAVSTAPPVMTGAARGGKGEGPPTREASSIYCSPSSSSESIPTGTFMEKIQRH